MVGKLLRLESDIKNLPSMGLKNVLLDIYVQSMKVFRVYRQFTCPIGIFMFFGEGYVLQVL